MSKGMRKALCALVLVIGLPVYIVLATTIIGWFDRPHLAVEALIYIVLGIAWTLPLKGLFRGVAARNPADQD